VCLYKVVVPPVCLVFAVLAVYRHAGVDGDAGILVPADCNVAAEDDGV
jgi:hypothetical protein